MRHILKVYQHSVAKPAAFTDFSNHLSFWQFTKRQSFIASKCLHDKGMINDTLRARQAGLESPALSSRDELIQKLVVGITTHALMLAAHVELTLQQLLVVSPCKRASQIPQATPAHVPRMITPLSDALGEVGQTEYNMLYFMPGRRHTLREPPCSGGGEPTGIYADRQAHVWGDPSAGAVERQLGDGHPHRLDAQIAQVADALAIRQADGFHAPLRPVLEQRVHPSCACSRRL